MGRFIPVGIDLGATFSAAATLDAAGRSMMLLNDAGEVLTPSAVRFTPAELIVGKDARGAALIDPDSVVERSKRALGSGFCDRSVCGRRFPPEVVQGCILRKLRTAIEPGSTKIRCAVGVPDHFDDRCRRAVLDAMVMAGLDDGVLVNETTAGALAWAESGGWFLPEAVSRGETIILVFDLGGDSFKCGLFLLAPGSMTALATDGDRFLGGDDWNQRLLDHAAEEFVRIHQLDPRTDLAARNRVLQAVIETKHSLSARPRSHLRIDYQGRSLDVLITRELFADLTADLLERTAYTIRQLLNESGLGWDRVSRVVLVGGATRMPMVAQMLRQLSGREPDRSVNPDEAVARGAALYAGLCGESVADGTESMQGSALRFAVRQSAPYRLGIEAYDPSSGGRINATIIPKGMPLPVARVEQFATESADQRSFAVTLLQGESSVPSDCITIGRAVVDELPSGLPAGWPIDLRFCYGEDGLVRIESASPEGPKVVFQRAGGLSPAVVSRWKEWLAGPGGFAEVERIGNEGFGLGDAEAAPAASSNKRHQAIGAQHDSSIGGRVVESPQKTLQGSTAEARGGENAPIVGEAANRPSEGVSAAFSSSSVGSIDNQSTLGPVEGFPRAPSGRSTVVPPEAPPVEVSASAMPPAVSAEVPAAGQRQTVPRWLIVVVGYLLSAIVGLGLGYLVLMWLRPESFPPPW